MDNESGYISLQLEQLNLSLSKLNSKELKVRIDIALVGNEVLKWSLSGKPLFSTVASLPALQSKQETDTSDSLNYILGFDQFVIRTTYIDLTFGLINSIADALIQIKVVSINDVVPVTAAKPAKGAPVVEATPPEEVLFEIIIPFPSLFTAKASTIDLSDPLNNLISSAVLSNVNNIVLTSETSIVLKTFADNDLAEYVLGAKFLRWESAAMKFPPATWGLRAPDVIDPKAKIQPTAVDLRNKYLDNIVKNVANQEKIAKFLLSVGGKTSSNSNNNENNDEQTIRDFFPTVALEKGKIFFDSELAKQVAIDKDIRAVSDLWTVKWDKSKVLFLHRSQVRKLVDSIKADASRAYIPLTVKKVPTTESMAAEGGELFATAIVDISSILTPGKSIFEIKVDLDGDLMTENNPLFTIQLSSSSPFLLSPVKFSNNNNKSSASTTNENAVATIENNSNTVRPIDKVSSKHVSVQDENKDALQELRDEIVSTIERVAVEYIAMYPNNNNKNNNAMQQQATFGIAATSNSNSYANLNTLKNNSQKPTTTAATPIGKFRKGVFVANANSNGQKSKEDIKMEFLNALKTSGLFHELKENLKPKVTLIIKDRYGARGRALGRSDVLTAVDTNNSSTNTNANNVVDFADVDKKKKENEEELLVQNVLSELYVFLKKECNVIFNSLFTETLIDKNSEELLKNNRVDDEEETLTQTLARLLNQAEDAFADKRFDTAAALHLERIQLVNNNPILGSDVDIAHEVHASYATFLLQQSAALLTSSVVVLDASVYSQSTSLLQQACEVLKIAYEKKPEEWEISLLYACTLIQLNESSFYDDAENVLHTVFKAQLEKNDKNKNKLSKKYNLKSFEETEFSGYESDELTPLDPKCFAVLAALFSMQNLKINARKALLLANRSFIEGDYKPSVKTHGTPKRTLVLILSQTTLFLCKFSLSKLGSECLKLALDCEAAITEKLKFQEKSSKTVPHIRFLLKIAQSIDSTFSFSIKLCTNNVVNNNNNENDEQNNNNNNNFVDKNRKLMFIQNNNKTLIEINEKSEEATELAEESVHKIKSLLHLYKTQVFTNEKSSQSVVDTILNAIEIASKNLTIQELKTKTSTFEYILPLEYCIEASKLLLQLSRFEESLSVLLFACSIYNSSTLFLLVSMCCLRLNQLEDAEDALMEANLLDNRNAEVWGFLCLLCLTTTSTQQQQQRFAEAESCRKQAMRLHLSNTTLLREIAVLYMSLDKLQIAEDVLRFALVCEEKKQNSTSSYTRKLLADVLAGENYAVKAIEEYQRVIGDQYNIEFSVRIDACQKCIELLSSIGRDEEVKKLKKIMKKLLNGEQQDNNNRNNNYNINKNNSNNKKSSLSYSSE